MNRLFSILWVVLCCASAEAAKHKPLSLHPTNPRYFSFRDKPAILLTSGEHYGAVLNKDFDYRPYLDELQQCGFNLTRTFAGTYREIPGSFGIVDNTLAPQRSRFACPWSRSGPAGAIDGGQRFDLTQYDPEYFQRLKDFLAEAGKRGIVVELVLFCTVYDDGLWRVNPMNPDNHTLLKEKVRREDVLTLKHPALVQAQEALVRKIVQECNEFDNLYYEICNEPYFAGVSLEWQARMAATIVATEKKLPRQHLIAQNIGNGSSQVKNPDPLVSIFNFHYCSPPDAVALNWELRKPIGFDETGFRGTADLPYRTDAWDFLIAGGAVYSHLDYSFTPRHPDGSFKVTTSPGGGGKNLRKQLQFLGEFMKGLDFIAMSPANHLIKKSSHAYPGNPPNKKEQPTVRVPAAEGKQYAVYFKGGKEARIDLELPKGTYSAEWVNPWSKATERKETLDHPGGVRPFQFPTVREDLALRILKIP